MHTLVGFQALDDSAIHELEATFFKILLAGKKASKRPALVPDWGALPTLCASSVWLSCFHA